MQWSGLTHGELLMRCELAIPGRLFATILRRIGRLCPVPLWRRAKRSAEQAHERWPGRDALRSSGDIADAKAITSWHGRQVMTFLLHAAIKSARAVFDFRAEDG